MNLHKEQRNGNTKSHCRQKNRPAGGLRCRQRLRCVLGRAEITLFILNCYIINAFVCLMISLENFRHTFFININVIINYKLNMKITRQYITRKLIYSEFLSLIQSVTSIN